MQHLRGFEDFHKLHLLGVPAVQHAADLTRLHSAFEVLHVGVSHIKALDTQEVIAAQARGFVQCILVSQVHTVDAVM